MRFSVTTVATDEGPPVADLARAIEERGLDGLWLPDHTHMPVAGRARYPLGDETPEPYRRTVDPIVGLAFAAAVTGRIRLGTGVLVVPQRDPIATAKALATLDHQSNGRLVVGVGYGWNTDEMADHGVDPGRRRARANEHIRCMQALWRDDVAEFAGEYVNLQPSWSWPKPAQRPLPVLFGGAPTARVFDHVAELGGGWIPLGGHGLADGVARLRDRVASAGRDPDTLEVVPFTSAATSYAKVEAFAAAGATEVAFELPGSAVFDTLDRLAAFVASWRGASPPVQPPVQPPVHARVDSQSIDS